MGRRIWVIDFKASQPWAYDCRVLKFRRLLPAGPVATSDPPSYDGIRQKHLVQVWTDPGGLRTLSVGSIRLKKPSFATNGDSEP